MKMERKKVFEELLLEFDKGIDELVGDIYGKELSVTHGSCGRKDIVENL